MKDPAMLLVGNSARGCTLSQIGELSSAIQHLEKALAVFDLRQPLPWELELSRVTSLSYLHYGLFTIGYPDRAWAKSREMLEVAQRSSVPYVLTVAFCNAALHNLMRGNGTAAQKHAEKAMALTEAFGFKSVSPLATTVNGAAQIAQGLYYEEGIAGMRRGISAWRAGEGTPHTWHLCHLAIGLGRIGRPQEGLEVVEGRFAFVAKTGFQDDIPWLHHVKGELRRAQNPSNAAVAELCYRTAIEIARRQSARIEELRATTSLARLLREQGKRDEARAMLAEIYDWFTEGFDTADLKNAKALLDELAG